MDDLGEPYTWSRETNATVVGPWAPQICRWFLLPSLFHFLPSLTSFHPKHCRGRQYFGTQQRQSSFHVLPDLFLFLQRCLQLAKLFLHALCFDLENDYWLSLRLLPLYRPRNEYSEGILSCWDLHFCVDRLLQHQNHLKLQKREKGKNSRKSFEISEGYWEF